MILDHIRTRFLGGDLYARATYTRVYTVYGLACFVQETDGFVVDGSYQLSEVGRSVPSTESSLWPAMSLGKSVVLNYLMNSSEQCQSSATGKYWF